MADESFLERSLKQVEIGLQEGRRAVPSSLLEEWTDDDGLVQVSFLFHPAARGGQGSKPPVATEHHVKELLAKKSMELSHRVPAPEFDKLAHRLRKRAATAKMDISDADTDTPETAVHWAALQRLEAIVKDPKWRADEQPAAFTESIFVGSARHAEDLSTLRSLGVTAVLNLAPGACDDPEDLFEDNGIAYLELDAEDFVGYPLFEMHLEAATAFVEQHATSNSGGKVLIHCFAGVNRSAAIAVAIIMLSGRKPLYEVVQACFERRPFILSNASFRQQLVQLAAENDLLPDPDGYARNYE